VSDTRLKERLLRESSDLTLEKAASLCGAAEACAKQRKEVQKTEKKPVHAMKNKPKPAKPSRPQQLLSQSFTLHEERGIPCMRNQRQSLRSWKRKIWSRKLTDPPNG